MTGRLDAAAEITPLNREWDHEAMIDMARLRSYRLGRTREQLSAADVAGALLFDPCNIRYATGYRLGPFQMHLPLSYLFIATDGPIVLFGPRPRTTIPSMNSDRRSKRHSFLTVPGLTSSLLAGLPRSPTS